MRFLHCADLHLGIENYGRLNPETGLHTRLEDFLRVLEAMVEFAVQERVDAVLCAGDIYRSSTPTPTHERELAARIARLSDAGIPTVLLAGNHDMPVAFGKASPLEVFRALQVPRIHVVTRPAAIQLDTRSGPLEIMALPWPSRSALMTQEEYRGLPEEAVRRELEARCNGWLQNCAEQSRPHGPRVLLAHLHVANARYSGTERAALLGRDPQILLSALAHTGFDYVALGHIHRHQDLNPAGHPHVVYSGSPERIDFSEEEEGKGFCLVELEPDQAGWRGLYRFVEIPARRFVTIHVEVGEKEDATAALLSAIERCDLRDAVVRLIYQFGHADTVQIDHRRLLRALEPAAHVASISGRSTTPYQRPVRGSFQEGETVIGTLRRYIESRPEWAPDAEELLRLGAELEQEVTAET